MANTVTTIQTVPANLKNGSAVSGLVCLEVNLDTAGADFTVYTPTNSDAYVTIFGLQYSSALAHTLIFKSYDGTTYTNLVTLPLPANAGVSNSLGEGIFTICKKGERLALNTSANIGKIALFILEIRQLTLR